MDCAGTALCQATPEVWIVQPDVVAERVEQGHVGIDVDRMRLAVHVEIDVSHRAGSPLRMCLATPMPGRIGSMIAGIANYSGRRQASPIGGRWKHPWQGTPGRAS